MTDVAERAGVSAKTVSNVVNGTGSFTNATRQRVLDAMEELGYRINLSARNLRKGQSEVIALAVPELSVPYFAEMAQLIVEAADVHGWTVLVDQTGGRRDRELAVAAGLRNGLVDGVILNPLQMTRADFARRRPDTPLVLLGERAHDSAADHVAIDNIAAARVATEHLLSTGRQRVAAIGATTEPAASTAGLRLAGYRQALADAGVPYNESLVAPVRVYHRSAGADAVEYLLKQPEPPDAVFCFNDLLALGAMRALLDHGFRVPDDVAVGGFDDIEESRFSAPRLTTIAPDKAQIAETAVAMLRERITGDRTAPPRDVEAAFRLEVRNSTVTIAPRADTPPAL